MGLEEKGFAVVTFEAGSIGDNLQSGQRMTVWSAKFLLTAGVLTLSFPSTGFALQALLNDDRRHGGFQRAAVSMLLTGRESPGRRKKASAR
jgi:hypothetical protein